uniref:Uncharacterized protein n=1 Tax=Rhizophora mucronata TaxID=61149 RepID=A0A2P2IXS5_RHIMU
MYLPDTTPTMTELEIEWEKVRGLTQNLLLTGLYDQTCIRRFISYPS